MNDRQQDGAAGKAADAEREREDERRRMRANLIAAAVVVALLGFGVYLFVEMRDAVRLEECLMSGRRNCARVDMPRD